MLHRSVRGTATLAALFALTSCQAALVTTHTDSDHTDGATVDGTISPGEYSTYSYTGSGSGFGGPLGGATLYMESDASNLYFGLSPVGTLGSNLITIFLDTGAAGFTDDSTMTDVSDGGRRVASQLTRNSTDNFPIEASHVIQFGGDGSGTFTNVFELTTGTHTYIGPTSSGSTDREASIALSTLGLAAGDSVDFFATLISDSGFSSNEGLPATGFGGNPGFGGSGNINWVDHHQFVVSVPEASSVLAMSLLTSVGVIFRPRRRM